MNIMENRFLEMDDYLKQCEGKGGRGTATRTYNNNGNGYAPDGTDTTGHQASVWSRPQSASQRVLVVLIENGGVDLGIPVLVDKVLDLVPGSSMLPDSVRGDLIDFLRKKIQGFTDNLIETAELSLNRYTAAKPDFFSDVVVLRDGTSSYQSLKNTLIDLSQKGKIIDLFILTHGSDDFISVPGGINSQKIRDMKAENGGKPLTIRSVYMMNCVGSTLNQAWLDAGAKASSGSIANNYLPEPTMFFFWSNWKNGQTFENAATGAYRKTIGLMKAAVEGFLTSLSPIAGLLSSHIDFENLDFVKSSAPVIQGQRSVTINTDDLSFTQSLSSSLATTVLPVNLLRLMGMAQSDGGASTSPQTVSSQGIDLIKGFEGFVPKKYNDPVGHCTIGYGILLHTGNCDGRAEEQPYNNGISEADATELLRKEVEKTQKVITAAVKVELNQNQNDALASFIYNIGAGAFHSSTLLKLLNQGKYDAVPVELKKWVKGRKNGEIITLPGLVKRRDAEAELFQKPATGTTQSLSHVSAGRSSSLATTMRFGIDTNTETTSFLPSLVATPIQDPVSGEAGGLDFIMRYLGRIKIAEVNAIHAAGLKVVSIVERTPVVPPEQLIQVYHAYFTFDRGKQDGQFGIDKARALGQTASTPIYFGVDYDDPAWYRGDFSNIIDYFNGVNTAMSDENFPFEVGVYGGGCVLKECQARHLTVRFWQANASGWCGNKTRLPFANVVQQTQRTFPGTTLLVDPDFSPNGDEGGW